MLLISNAAPGKYDFKRERSFYKFCAAAQFFPPYNTTKHKKVWIASVKRHLSVIFFFQSTRVHTLHLLLFPAIWRKPKKIVCVPFFECVWPFCTIVAQSKPRLRQAIPKLHTHWVPCPCIFSLALAVSLWCCSSSQSGSLGITHTHMTHKKVVSIHNL